MIGVPRAHLGAHADTLQRQSAVRLPTDSGLRHVVGGFFRAMTDTLRAGHADFSGSAGRHLSDAVTSLIISELVDASTPPPESDLADQILAYCMTRLSDPSLSAASVAKAHRISVRYLHKLFQAREFSLAAWIRHQRLQGIRRDLADPALAGRTVAVDLGPLGRAERDAPEPSAQGRVRLHRRGHPANDVGRPDRRVTAATAPGNDGDGDVDAVVHAADTRIIRTPPQALRPNAIGLQRGLALLESPPGNTQRGIPSRRRPANTPSGDVTTATTASPPSTGPASRSAASEGPGPGGGSGSGSVPTCTWCARAASAAASQRRSCTSGQRAATSCTARVSPGSASITAAGGGSKSSPRSSATRASSSATA